MFRIVKPDVNLDFTGKVKTFGVVSVILVIISSILVFTKGLNYGIDFKGGTNIVYNFENTPDVNSIRKILDNNKIEGAVSSVGKNGVSIQISKSIEIVKAEEIEKLKKHLDDNYKSKGFKGSKKYIEGSNRLRVMFDNQQDGDILFKELHAAGFNVESVELFGIDEKSESQMNMYQLDINFTQIASFLLDKITKTEKGKVQIASLEQVGPKVGEKLKQDGVLSVLYALFAILVYIGFRFDSRFSPGAVICLFHDVMITLGIFSAFNISFDLSVVAALLTLVGYSLNDTIIVFDRIREFVEEHKANKLSKETLESVVNKAINSTLGRTVLTSATTLFVVIALEIFGDISLRPFAIALFVGITIGTYSSIFIASPIYVWLEKKYEKKMKELEALEAKTAEVTTEVKS